MRRVSVVLVVLAIALAGCGSDDRDSRSYEELFDTAVEMYCTEDRQDCHMFAAMAMGRMKADDMPRERVLAYMVDDLDPERYPTFQDAMVEAMRAITMGR